MLFSVVGKCLFKYNSILKLFYKFYLRFNRSFFIQSARVDHRGRISIPKRTRRRQVNIKTSTHQQKLASSHLWCGMLQKHMAGRKPKTVNLWSLLLGLLLPSMVLSQDLIYNMFENEPIGTLIGNIGQDLNLTSGAPASVHYNILVSQNSQYFDVDHASGNLFTSAVLDREYICQYETTCGLEINVMASSGAYNQMISITVMLLDVNDNTPSFSQAQFTLRISESAMIGSEFALPKAMDDDMSSNNSIQSYSIRWVAGR